MITQAHIAHHLGVSRSTVKAVLSNNRRIALSEQTRARVLAAAHRLSYRPDRHAQVMRRGRTMTIGLLQFSGFLHVNDLRAMHAAKAIHAAGYHLHTSHLLWTLEGIQEAIDSLLAARVEGVLLVGPVEIPGHQYPRQLLDAGIPVVALSGTRFPGVPQVRTDFRQAMFELATHVVRLGKRRLVLLTQWGSHHHDEWHDWAILERVAGVQAAAAELPGASVEIVCAEPTADPHGAYGDGRTTMARLLARGGRTDAVLCSNDGWAIGALAACHAAGVRVPDQVAITGVDNDPVGAFTHPPLTTVEQPTAAMAQCAVAILLKLINGEKLADGAELVQLPGRLVLRESCGRGGRA